MAARDAILPLTSRGIFMLRGGPGSGKSLLARIIASHRAMEDRVIMCAPTNFIKRRLSAYADTLHGMVDIPMGRTFYGLKTNHTHLRTLATCHTIIVDEAFMVTAQNLEFLLTRLSAAQDLSLDAVLEHNTIVLVGDEKQLPPICQSTCLYVEDVCTLRHIAVSPHFRQAYHDPARNFFLAVNHRNPAMAYKLAHIASQHSEPLTQAWGDENINNAYCRVAPLDLDTRVLVTRHVDALSHNTAAHGYCKPKVGQNTLLSMGQNSITCSQLRFVQLKIFWETVKSFLAYVSSTVLVKQVACVECKMRRFVVVKTYSRTVH